MNGKRIVIFGAEGTLGRYVSEVALEYQRGYSSSGGGKVSVQLITRKEMNLSDEGLNENGIKDIISNTIIQGQRNYLINCIGVTRQQPISTTGSGSDRDMIFVNTVFPRVLAEVVARYKQQEVRDRSFGSTLSSVVCLHISTDCVFDGSTASRGSGYTETDKPTEKGLYGLTKALGEDPSLQIIRTSIIGESARNRELLLEWFKGMRGKSVIGYTNHMWNGITCLELARFIIGKVVALHVEWRGVKHLFSAVPVSKCELLKLINEVYELGVTITEGRTSRDINRVLSSISTHYQFPPILQQLRDLRIYSVVREKQLSVSRRLPTNNNLPQQQLVIEYRIIPGLQYEVEEVTEF